MSAIDTLTACFDEQNHSSYKRVAVQRKNDIFMTFQGKWVAINIDRYNTPNKKSQEGPLAKWQIYSHVIITSKTGEINVILIHLCIRGIICVCTCRVKNPTREECEGGPSHEAKHQVGHYACDLSPREIYMSIRPFIPGHVFRWIHIVKFGKPHKESLRYIVCVCGLGLSLTFH